MKKRTAGFTLTEVMVAVTVLTIMMAGVMGFYLQMSKGIYVSAQRVELGRNIRHFTDELVRNASRSNECILYLSATNTDRDAATDRQELDTDAVPLAHPAGDFVVFVFYEIPKPANQPKHRINFIRGYFVVPSSSTIGLVRKVEIDLTASPSTSDVETILTNNWSTNARFSDFVLNVRGLAPNEVILTGPNAGPRLFYKNDKRAIAVSGQIFQSNAGNITNDWKTYTESFNFIVTPRS